jgi:hypothetical protein
MEKIFEDQVSCCITLRTGVCLSTRRLINKLIIQRFFSLFSQLFDEVRKKNPDYRQKIHPINGDCILEGLGISPSDRALLAKHCNIVFHGAATVRFDEKLKLALAINVCGTREIIKIVKEMEHLQVNFELFNDFFLSFNFLTAFMFLKQISGLSSHLNCLRQLPTHRNR